jgi:hypothetical protein
MSVIGTVSNGVASIPISTDGVSSVTTTASVSVTVPPVTFSYTSPLDFSALGLRPPGSPDESSAALANLLMEVDQTLSTSRQAQMSINAARISALFQQAATLPGLIANESAELETARSDYRACLIAYNDARIGWESANAGRSDAQTDLDDAISGEALIASISAALDNNEDPASLLDQLPER